MKSISPAFAFRSFRLFSACLLSFLMLASPLAPIATGYQDSKPLDVRELKPEAPIERELAAGAVHIYKVTLTAGQFLKAVIDQKGIDVVVRLFGPDGKQITEVDSPNGSQGPEPVAVIAEATGEYRLEVKSLEKAGGAGRYGVRVEELREPTAEDRDRLAAERAATKALAEAQQLRAGGTAESLRKAIEKYAAALPFLRLVGDRQREALTLNDTGTVYWQLGESRKALECYDQALPIWRAAGNQTEEARTLHNIGTAYWQLSESRKALEYYNQALPLRRSMGDRNGTAITLSAIGLAHSELGRLKEALDYFNQSLALRPTGANTLENIGSTYSALGDWQKALEYYNQARSLNREAGNRRSEANSLSNIGLVYWQLGENQKALEYYNQALPLRRATGDRVGEATTLHLIGYIYYSLNELQKALEQYNQTLTVAREVGNRRLEAITLQDIGVLYMRLGDSQKALDFLNQALLLQRAMGDLVGEAFTLSNIGETYSLLGKPADALSYLERALSLQRGVGDRNNEARTLRRIARVERKRGRFDEARAQIETALNLMEGTRSTLISQQDRTSFSASKQDYYELYIDVLMGLHQVQPLAGHDAAALQASERARARGLLEILTEARADIRQGVDPVLLERERSSQQQLNIKSERLTKLLSGKHTEEQERTARNEVEALLTDYQDVQTQIRTKSPRYAALTQSQPSTSKEIQGLLDDNTLLLEYALGEERSYLWAVTSTSIKSFELPKRAEIEATARRFYELVTTQKNREIDAQSEAAATLSRMLVGPVASQLGRKRLVIIGDGTLLYIPFAALPEPGPPSEVSSKVRNKYQPLIVKHEVVSLPSASVLAVVRRELTGRLPSAKKVAVLADPVFQRDDPRVKSAMANAGKTPPEGLTRSGSSGDLKSEVETLAWESGAENFQRLQHSREEAEAIVAQARAKDALLALDFAANRATVMSGQLSQYQIVHFATHGLVNNVHPELSGIVLSLVDETGHPTNGFVRLHEVYNMKLPAELVVLSGCRTALGKEVRGEGLVGLTRGFMYAGAPRVVVSLWPVSDKGTAELMKRFYEGMLGKGLRPAAALREAQIAMWKTDWWDAPYYWAGFVLQGEWR